MSYVYPGEKKDLGLVQELEKSWSDGLWNYIILTLCAVVVSFFVLFLFDSYILAYAVCIIVYLTMWWLNEQHGLVENAFGQNRSVPLKDRKNELDLFADLSDTFHIFPGCTVGSAGIETLAIGPTGVFAIHRSSVTGSIFCKNEYIYRNSVAVGDSAIKNLHRDCAALRRALSSRWGDDFPIIPVALFDEAVVVGKHVIRGVHIVDSRHVCDLLRDGEKVVDALLMKQLVSALRGERLQVHCATRRILDDDLQKVPVNLRCAHCSYSLTAEDVSFYGTELCPQCGGSIAGDGSYRPFVPVPPEEERKSKKWSDVVTSLPVAALSLGIVVLSAGMLVGYLYQQTPSSEKTQAVAAAAQPVEEKKVNATEAVATAEQITNVLLKEINEATLAGILDDQQQASVDDVTAAGAAADEAKTDVRDVSAAGVPHVDGGDNTGGLSELMASFARPGVPAIKKAAPVDRSQTNGNTDVSVFRVLLFVGFLMQVGFVVATLAMI